MMRMTVARALISGVTPRLTCEKISMGSVLAPAPARKKAMTNSSSERAMASRDPPTTLCHSPGSVTFLNTIQREAPRS